MTKTELDKLQSLCQDALARTSAISAALREAQDKLNACETWIRDTRAAVATVDATVRDSRQKMEVEEDDIFILTDEVLPPAPIPVRKPFSGGGPDFEGDIIAAIEGVLRG